MGLRVDLDLIAGRVDIVGTGIDRQERQLVGIAARGEEDHAALLELPGDAAGNRQLAAGLGQDRAYVGRRAVLVVGGRLDDDRHAARAVALVHDLFELLAFAAASRLLDGALDRVEWHVLGAGAFDRQPEPEVAVDVTAAGSRGNADLAAHLREDGAALDVVDAFLALDL